MKKPTKEINAYKKAKAALLKSDQALALAIAPEFLRCCEEDDRDGLFKLIAMLPEGFAGKRRCYEAIGVLEDMELAQ